MTTTSKAGGWAWAIANDRFWSFAIAIGVVLIASFLLAKLTKDPNAPPSRWFGSALICGADGRASTSKFQALLWTAIGFFALVEVFIERLWNGSSSEDLSLPTNMLIAMGFSVTTMAAAKGITVSYAAKNLVDKSPTPLPGHRSTLLGGLATDDDGTPDLSKIQMLAFTVIAAIIYLLRMALPDRIPWVPELADIESSLMVMMGLSQGAYLGKKLTTIQMPRITGMTPALAAVGARITLTGVGFGEHAGTVLLDNTPLSGTTSWKDNEIQFEVPKQPAPNVTWTLGARVTVQVIANGYQVQSLAPFVLDG